ncbi:hypothetical protein RxyAA322_20140 [Rubrobacter xylanophilus]|uniref:Uncharacterized protein n=1 Tax=Rubrobacter xylanophilus TaxID=49319 RepID=A0A510HJI1_9ACTN|nr:tetratricopeptide repeat protein [Rubrobacter xylanophilus]BBL80160.1 hypothetical protein RxyAA322_20140 [Rubrobacter xylanophilus]
MSQAALSTLLILLVLLATLYTIYAGNRDLIRARAWGELSRRALPFLALLVMASTVLFVRNLQQGWAMLAWFAAFGLLIVLSSVLSVPAEERKAGRAFRRGDYAAAADLYRELVERRPLARHYAFLGAALGAAGRLEESVEASTEAINRDPEYGLAYYNRALVLRQLRKKSRARKDLERALETDLPRRFRSAVRRQLEELR